MSVIHLENICLDYVFRIPDRSIKKLVANIFSHFFLNKTHPVLPTSFRALNNINLELKKGDRVGLVGANGAGKSTLLRTLAKIYMPSSGKISVNGKVTAMLNSSLGLNPEMTGYENIMSLGLIRGFTRKEIRDKQTEIAEFTELGSFLNAPVHTYSQGMCLRLSFAVLTADVADILLVDEVIGAGDAAFLAKAQARFTNMVEASSLLVLASHDANTIRMLCNKLLYLERGQVKFFGDVEEGFARYYHDIGLSVAVLA